MRKLRPNIHKTHTNQKIALIIFGLLLGMILLELGLRIGGFILLSIQEHKNKFILKQKGSYRIMCLGESTTAGWGGNSYPRYLQEILNQRDVGIKFAVINKGIIGTNTGAIALDIEYNLDKYSPDMVITMMGINDGRYNMAYENIPVNKQLLLIKSLRIYKFLRLLQFHIIAKIQELGIYKQNKQKKSTFKAANHLAYLDALKKQEDASKAEKETVILSKVDRLIKQGIVETQNDIFKKIKEIDIDHNEAYGELGFYYYLQGKYIRAEQLLKKAIEIDPPDEHAYILLGKCYTAREEYYKAEQMLKTAIRINPTTAYGYEELGFCYKNENRYGEAEEMYKKAIELNPKISLVGLIRLYKELGRYDKAVKELSENLEMNPKDEWIYASLGQCYNEMGNMLLAEWYYSRANELRLSYYNLVTRRNYNRVKEIVAQKGAKLVCVQYPVRSIASLKKMFYSKKGVIFVDNEQIFKEAINETSYDEYFTDMIGGDFGHCTEKGNKLLAENIANVILEKCFNE